MQTLLATVLYLIGQAVPLLGRHTHKPMTGEEINTMLKHYKVVPDVIDDSNNYDQLTVVYNYTIFLDYGTKVIPQQIENKPTRLQWPIFGKELYSLVFIEPDHPLKARNKTHQFVHWLVVNIPGTQVEKGEEIADYIGYRSFYEEKKPHRLVYLVYKQPDAEPMKFDEKKLITAQVVERGHYYNFTGRGFAEKYGLTGPVAVNLAFIECKKMWHGRKYKVFRNETATTEVDLFPDEDEVTTSRYQSTAAGKTGGADKKKDKKKGSKKGRRRRSIPSLSRR